jgi:hypothetical protein
LYLINITREESLYLRQHGAQVVVLNKQAPARKKKYMVPEDRLTARLLDQYHREQKRYD